MSNPYLGEIRIFGGNFAPTNWALCGGQLVMIAQYSNLFSLIGTTYGGNGTQTFALPNLQSRGPIGTGSGPGLTPRGLAAAGGAESVNALQPTTKVTGSGASAFVAGSPSIPTVSPFLAVNFIISLAGNYPST
jgi:microcystin-dependent protein